MLTVEAFGAAKLMLLRWERKAYDVELEHLMPGWSTRLLQLQTSYNGTVLPKYSFLYEK